MKSATPHTMTATLMYCTHERVDGVEMGLVGLQLGCIMLGYGWWCWVGVGGKGRDSKKREEQDGRMRECDVGSSFVAFLVV